MTIPIFRKKQKAIVAVDKKVVIFIFFDLSRTAIPYVNESQSTDVTDAVKSKLGIR